MKRKAALLVAIILVSLAVAIQPKVYAPGANWLVGWSYRKSHVINNATNSGTNYQVRIIVVNGSAADSGDTVQENNKARADFGDIRFTDDDGNTTLDYWMETLNTGVNATFWVEVADDLSATAQTIYVYYGNSGVATTSNGANTFRIFNDGSSVVGWTEYDSTDNPSWSATSGVIRFNSTGAGPAGGQLVCDTNLTLTTWAFEANIRAQDGLTGSNYQQALSFEESPTAVNYYVARWIDAAGFDYWMVTVIGSSSSAADGAFDARNWHKYSLFENTTKITNLYVDNVFKVTRTEVLDHPAWYLGLWSYATAQYHWVEYDDIRVRKYVFPEPSHAAWGAEEVHMLYFYGTASQTFTVGSSPVKYAWKLYGIGPQNFTTALLPVKLGIFSSASQIFSTALQDAWAWLLGPSSSGTFSASATMKGYWFIPAIPPAVRDPLIYVAVGFALVALGMAATVRRKRK
jgi:hypothetical protein